MHLIINTLSVAVDGGGIKTYLINIISALANLKNPPEITLICSHSSKPVFQDLSEKENIRFITIPVSSKLNLFRIILDQVVVPVVLLVRFRRSNKILITPSSVATIYSPLKQITIIQAPLVLKNIRGEVPAVFLNDLTSLRKIYYDLFLPKTVDKSQRLITVSKYLKKKVESLEPDAVNKTHVVYEGVDFDSFDLIDSEEKESETEILFVSTLYSYKNADKVIKAFGRAIEVKQISEDTILRVIGNDPSGGERMEKLQILARECNIGSRIIFSGYIAHREIGKYYKKASVFVFPSSVETFGLPPLEAMACGVPVIASNRMSVPEIVGDAGLVVDPNDIDSIADSFENILKDHQLRRELIRKGYKRAREFNWKIAGKRIIEIAESL